MVSVFVIFHDTNFICQIIIMARELSESAVMSEELTLKIESTRNLVFVLYKRRESPSKTNALILDVQIFISVFLYCQFVGVVSTAGFIGLCCV